MKLSSAVILAISISGASAFATPKAFGVTASRRDALSTSLSMVLEKPKTDKKLSKLEVLKTKSNHLTDPLKDVSTLVD